MRRKIWIVAGGLVLAVLGTAAIGQFDEAGAMPPYPGLAEQSPPMAAAVAHYQELRQAFAERGIDQPGGGLAAGTQLSGDFNMLAVCVRFSDHASSVPATDFDDLMFDQTGNSVWDYYQEVSYGTFSILSVDLPSDVGWQTAPLTYSYYVNNNYGFGSYPHNSQKLVEDLVDLIDPLVDFSVYDNDGNGYVDGLVVVHSGTGAEFTGSTSDIWSHKWGIVPRQKDGVYISSYSIQPEFWSTPGDITIGVYAHEIGHVFGLPDLYDLDGSSRGIGKWSLMANGSWNGYFGNSPAHLDAWCRSQLGFCTPTIVTDQMIDASLPAIETTPLIYRLWPDGGGTNEYFLIENRQKTGYDAPLPGSGILIWHVDESQSSNSNEWYPGHTSSGHYWVALEQADSLWQLEKSTSYGDAGDPFPGTTNKTTFSAASTPSSNDYTGAATYVTITNISPSGATMTCDFQVGLGTGILDGDDNEIAAAVPSAPLISYPNPFNPSTVICYALDQSGSVELNVYDILGRHVVTLADGAEEAGVHSVNWNGADRTGAPVASGVYFARLVTESRSTAHKMVLVR
jgi:immune inhibitor A